MALFFISIGLSDETDMSMRALDTARSCQRLYAEFHTSKLNTDRERLEKFTGRKIDSLSRHDMEENYINLLSEAGEKSVGILVGGDAMIATAHAAIMCEAKKRGIEVKVIHGQSIVSAVCEAGLHMQKMGPMTTIPFPERTMNGLPESVYNVIMENQKRGLHTLCLMDMVSEEDRFMEVSEALSILMKLEKDVNRNVISKDTELVVYSRMGSDTQGIRYGRLKDMMETSFGDPPHCLVVIGKLHFSESACLQNQK